MPYTLQIDYDVIFLPVLGTVDCMFSHIRAVHFFSWPTLPKQGGKSTFQIIFFKKRKNDLIHPRIKFHTLIFLKSIFVNESPLLRGSLEKTYRQKKSWCQIF